MILSDLVSSVSNALPRLVATSARRRSDEKLFAPNIGYGFFRPGNSTEAEPFDIEDGSSWLNLETAAVGILGAGPLAQAVGVLARQQFGSHVAYYHSESLGEVDCETTSRWFGSLMAAPVICVVLPWPEGLAVEVQKYKLTPGNPHSVLVVWRRSPAIERAIVHLGRHYMEQMQLCELAKVACISKFHLVRQFTTVLGITPHRYQVLLRLSHAKAMLREGGCITRIAQCVGFGDHSHLDRRFRSLMGMTPTQYQQTVEH